MGYTHISGWMEQLFIKKKQRDLPCVWSIIPNKIAATNMYLIQWSFIVNLLLKNHILTPLFVYHISSHIYIYRNVFKHKILLNYSIRTKMIFVLFSSSLSFIFCFFLVVASIQPLFKHCRSRLTSQTIIWPYN